MGMTDKETAKALETTAGANLLNNYIMRIDTQLEFALEEVALFDPTEFSHMAMMIARLSADPLARMTLLRRCSELIKHLIRQFPLPELTKKKVMQVQESILYCFGSHFGKWEELMQSGAVKVMQKTRVLEEELGLSDNVMSQLADVMDQDRSERPSKGKWMERRRERLKKMALEEE